jgi:hypothetical protein
VATYACAGARLWNSRRTVFVITTADLNKMVIKRIVEQTLAACQQLVGRLLRSKHYQVIIQLQHGEDYSKL